MGDIKRKKRGLTAPAVGMRGAAGVGDAELQALLGQVQSNIYAINDRLAALDAAVGALRDESERAAANVQKPYETANNDVADMPTGGQEGWYGRVRVDSAGHVVEGTEEIEEVDTFPAIPERPTIIWIDGQMWGSGPDLTKWYPLMRLTDVVGEPGTTP